MTVRHAGVGAGQIRRAGVFGKGRGAGRGALAAGLVAAAPLAAQEVDPAPYHSIWESCVEGTEHVLECEGRAAAACMEAEPDGQTTVGMASCTAMETAFWDARLNAIWPELRARIRDLDAMDTGPAGPRNDALLEAQRAWIAFRDAECGLDYAMWGSGSMRQIEAAACHLEMTAARVVRLTDLGTSP